MANMAKTFIQSNQTILLLNCLLASNILYDFSAKLLKKQLVSKLFIRNLYFSDIFRKFAN